MLSKNFLIVVIALLIGANLVHGQGRSAATKTGAQLISGTFSFSSQGGDLYMGSSDERITTISVIPGWLYYVAPGFGIGGDLTYQRISVGEFSLTQWGIGPKLGYFVESENNAIPFVAAAVNYLAISESEEDYSDTGFSIKGGGGVMFRKDHLAVSFEAGYIFEQLKVGEMDETETGNTIFIALGLAGFLY